MINTEIKWIQKKIHLKKNFNLELYKLILKKGKKPKLL